MRIVKREDIILSKKEMETWEKFQILIDGIEREVSSPDIGTLLQLLQENLSDLWEYIEMEA